MIYSIWQRIDPRFINQSSCMGLLLILFSVILSGCQTHMTQPTEAHQGAVQTENKKRSILIVNSHRSIDRYQVAEQAFINQIQSQTNASEITQIDLAHEEYPERLLQELLNQENHSHIYCIGAKALGSIDTIAPPQPIVFSSVLNWARFENQQGISGIASDIAPASQLAMFKLFFTEIQSVAVLYSQRNRALIRKLAQAAEQVGITLNTVEINERDSIEAHMQQVSLNNDALWLLSDPVVLSSVAKAKQLFATADQHNLPVFSTNRFFKELGATFIISADRPTIGRQAALLISADNNETQNKIHYPVGSHISLNMSKVEQYKLNLNFQALDNVNELIE